MELAQIKRHHGIVAPLDNNEELAVLHACIGGKTSAPDAAIIFLALVAGLRACDLFALQLQDIDWRGMTIGTVQQKTGNPLTIPLLPAVAGKLAGYCPE